MRRLRRCPGLAEASTDQENAAHRQGEVLPPAFVSPPPPGVLPPFLPAPGVLLSDFASYAGFCQTFAGRAAFCHKIWPAPRVLPPALARPAGFCQTERGESCQDFVLSCRYWPLPASQLAGKPRWHLLSGWFSRLIFQYLISSR